MLHVLCTVLWIYYFSSEMYNQLTVILVNRWEGEGPGFTPIQNYVVNEIVM
jgi:hypothetical protein